MKTPSAWAPAAFNERGCDAARKTGLARFTHGRWAVPPRYEAGRPRRSSLTHATPSELARRQARRAEVAGAAVADADTEHGATRREQVDGRDRRRRDRRMAGDEVRDTDSDPRAPRALGQERRRHPGIHRDPERVRDSHHVVAERI